MNSLSDNIVMSRRVLRHAFRSMDTLITVVIMPVMMMLLFKYVFGGMIKTGSIDYINYIVPGIIVMTIVSSVAYTAFRLNIDIQTGIVDRFRSMPIAKTSILTGHVLTSIVFNAISVIIVFAIAFLVGFRAKAGIIEWLLVIGILLFFILAMTWLSIIFGIIASSAEGAGAFSYILMMLNFVSSAFVPADSMKGIVRTFAENQPMTPIMDTVRSLLINGNTGNGAMAAVIWCVVILFVSYIISKQIYNHKYE
jgi:ABC-2 type transport system permease protein